MKNLIYVHDINESGNKSEIIKVAKNLKKMSEEKRFTFNIEKAAYIKGKKHVRTCLHVRTSRKEKKRNKDYAQKEKHQKRSRYKYLEIWINEKENLEKHLEEMETKVPFMINEVKRLEDPQRVGIMTPKIKFKIYEAIIMPIMMYAIQTWSKL